jgi:glycosyltransferase involved in cell wall biosynthesis
MNTVSMSVAMCTYNGEVHLREQLRSIVAQTRIPDEVVICDDRSVDQTMEIVTEFARRAPFSVRLVGNCKNLGISKNFERVLGLCRGEILVLCDQDDSWYPEKLQLIERAFIERPDAGLVFTDADVVNEGLEQMGYRLWKAVDFRPRLRRKVEAGRGFDALLRYNFVTGAAMAFRAQFRPLVLPIPKLWVHDAWIAILVSAAAEVVCVDRALMRYRQHSHQQIGARKRTIASRLSGTQERRNQSEYEQRVEEYILVLRRLREQRDFEIADGIEELLRMKIQHMACRAQLPKSRIQRLSAIGRELWLNHYSKFGTGWRGAARDLAVNLDGQL